MIGSDELKSLSGLAVQMIEEGSGLVLDFSPPTLNPIPTETLGTLPPADVWGFLANSFPIDSLDFLALHVAQITVGVAELKQRIEALETERE